LLHVTRSGVFVTDVSGDYNQTGGSVLLNATSGRISDLIVSGDFTLSDGILNMATSTNTGYYGRLYIDGHYIQTGGTLTATGASGTNSINFRGVEKDYAQSSGTVTNTMINYVLGTANSSLYLNNNIDI